MKNQLFPESVSPGEGYSFWLDVKLNLWALAAVAVAIGSRSVLHQTGDWSEIARALVALTPLIPSGLYVRALAQRLQGLDELQRGIQIRAYLFATTGALFVVTALDLVRAAGVSLGSRIRGGLGWEGMFVLVVLLFIVGNYVFNRRYR